MNVIEKKKKTLFFGIRRASFWILDIICFMFLKFCIIVNNSAHPWRVVDWEFRIMGEASGAEWYESMLAVLLLLSRKSDRDICNICLCWLSVLRLLLVVASNWKHYKYQSILECTRSPEKACEKWNEKLILG